MGVNYGYTETQVITEIISYVIVYGLIIWLAVWSVTSLKWLSESLNRIKRRLDTIEKIGGVQTPVKRFDDER